MFPPHFLKAGAGLFAAIENQIAGEAAVQAQERTFLLSRLSKRVSEILLAGRRMDLPPILHLGPQRTN
jgi:hypothetical protein